MEVVITPQGKLLLREKKFEERQPAMDAAASTKLLKAFAESTPHGLLFLATYDLKTVLSPALDFLRQFTKSYLTRLCQTPAAEDGRTLPEILLTTEDAAGWVEQAPPLLGLEYLSEEVITHWWEELDTFVRAEIAHHAGGAQAYLSEKNPAWRMVGKVTLHLAENKQNQDYPFAFLTTLASKLSAQGRIQHEPLGRALQHFSGARNRPALLNLLLPLHKAAETSPFIQELISTNQIYQPLAWTPSDAYRFLQEIPQLEASGLIVRVPDWWKSNRPPKPTVSVKIDTQRKSLVGVDSILDFSLSIALEGVSLSQRELESILQATDGLVNLKGKWIEVDRQKLTEALEHWKEVESVVQQQGLTFFQGMRLLAGVSLDSDVTRTSADAVVQNWSGLTPGPGLEKLLTQLRSPETLEQHTPHGLQAQLRPYQQTGWSWLRFLTKLGLGACLADDMGLGKTIQVIALLLDEKQQTNRHHQEPQTSLLIVPASLIANWKSEITRFAPSLSLSVVHPSELTTDSGSQGHEEARERDLVMTTYGMATRIAWLREFHWNIVILDEAQAIKNSGTRQTKAVKELKSRARIAMTGTPVENRLSDLWSLFDFLNPGLLGSAKKFASLVKKLDSGKEHANYGPLRKLIQPYILRRLKTDKRVISDLPDKIEMNAFCPLTKQQAALYEKSVLDLTAKLKSQDQGIQRRGIVLAQLLRLKQICNHPSQFLGTGDYEPAASGKFARLAALCEEMSQRQEKVLVFTQFREMTAPLCDFLSQIFGRSGLILHGSTSVKDRRQLVEQFQQIDGPPFFVLSLKAGGTGLNLTEANHVIHFDRWWNPAVENQATDRAFRIGQKRNVLVHKFVCRGTLEEKIDQMISQKKDLSNEVIEGGGEALLTELSDSELLKFVALDATKSLDS